MCDLVNINTSQRVAFMNPLTLDSLKVDIGRYTTQPDKE